MGKIGEQLTRKPRYAAEGTLEESVMISRIFLQCNIENSK